MPNEFASVVAGAVVGLVVTFVCGYVPDLLQLLANCLTRGLFRVFTGRTFPPAESAQIGSHYLAVGLAKALCQGWIYGLALGLVQKRFFPQYATHGVKIGLVLGIGAVYCNRVALAAKILRNRSVLLTPEALVAINQGYTVLGVLVLAFGGTAICVGSVAGYVLYAWAAFPPAPLWVLLGLLVVRFVILDIYETVLLVRASRGLEDRS